MGDFVCQSLTMKIVAALVTIALHQAAADWSGSGEFSCYGHVSTDVTSPEGGDHLGEGTLNCNIIEWGGGPLGPEAMVIALETLSALAAESFQTSSNIEQRIFSYFL